MDAATVIRTARRQAGLSQAALASRLGTTQSAIARIETGASEPTLSRVDLVVRAAGGRLRVSLDPPAADGPSAAVAQQRWDDAVRVANFVLDGRAALRAR